jgi:hypothetical protein
MQFIIIIRPVNTYILIFLNLNNAIAKEFKPVAVINNSIFNNMALVSIISPLLVTYYYIKKKLLVNMGQTEC